MASLSPSTSSPLKSESVFSNMMLNMNETPKIKEKKTQLKQQEDETWKWHRKKHMYISKICKAFERMNLRSVLANQGKAVSRVTDRVLAQMAGGRSRAILMKNKLKLGFMELKRGLINLKHRVTKQKPPTQSEPTVYPLMKKINTEAVRRDATILGRVIPASRDLLLEESADYIAELRMQAQAMEADIIFRSRRNSRTSSAPATTPAPTTSY